MQRSVVVLGAGVGGLRVADALRRCLPDGDRVVLVDRNDEQVLGLSLLWVMRGWRDPQQVTVRPSVVGRRGVEFVQGEVQAIDLAVRRVRLEDGTDLAYDALVIALGATLDASAVPGLDEALRTRSAGEYYTLAGAVQMRQRLQGFERGRICVLVSRTPFRCPAAPYEGALLLADLCQERGSREAVEVDVFTPETLPMPVAGPEVGRALVDLLEHHQIRFHPKMEVESVEPEARELRFRSGEREPYDFLAVVPPHRPPRSVAETGLGQQGWIPVDPTTLRTRAEGVWGIGDVASVQLANGLMLPKAAVFAEGEAEVVAREVARHLGHGGEELRFDGAGACWIEVGHAEAAYGTGNFYALPDPAVQLQPPSADHHRAKEAQERAWIEAWAPP